MKYLLPLLPLLFCTLCAILLLAQPRQERATVSGPPSAALLDAMSSHGIEVSNAADTAADAPASEAPAAAPVLQPAVDLAADAPALQPAAYHPGGRR